MTHYRPYNNSAYLYAEIHLSQQTQDQPQADFQLVFGCYTESMMELGFQVRCSHDLHRGDRPLNSHDFVVEDPKRPPFDTSGIGVHRDRSSYKDAIDESQHTPANQQVGVPVRIFEGSVSPYQPDDFLASLPIVSRNKNGSPI